MRGNYSGDQLEVLEELILNLIDTSDAMKPRGKKRICFEPEEIWLARRCLIDWRKVFLTAKQYDAADQLDDLLGKLYSSYFWFHNIVVFCRQTYIFRV